MLVAKKCLSPAEKSYPLAGAGTKIINVQHATTNSLYHCIEASHIHPGVTKMFINIIAQLSPSWSEPD